MDVGRGDKWAGRMKENGKEKEGRAVGRHGEKR
jgi:hypothetical protein